MSEQMANIVTVQCNGTAINIPLESFKRIVFSGEVHIDRYLSEPVTVAPMDAETYQARAERFVGRAQAYQAFADALDEMGKLRVWLEQLPPL